MSLFVAGCFLLQIFLKSFGQVGTGLIGGLVSFPIAYYIMGKATVAWFFIPPFLVSTIGGSIIAGLLIRSGVLSGISSTLLPLNKHKKNM